MPRQDTPPSGEIDPCPDLLGKEAPAIFSSSQHHRVDGPTPPVSPPAAKHLQQPNTSSKLIKWAIELSEFDIIYKGRTSTKGQAVADFISEFTNAAPHPEIPATEPTADDRSKWNLFVNGSSNQLASGAGVILTGQGNTLLEYALRFDFKASNNMAEYEALVVGVQLTLDLGADSLNIFSHSQLVVNQVTRELHTWDTCKSSYAG